MDPMKAMTLNEQHFDQRKKCCEFSATVSGNTPMRVQVIKLRLMTLYHKEARRCVRRSSNFV